MAELTAAMIVANMTPERETPRAWAKRKPSGTDRTKVKAARKQKRKCK